MVGRTPVEIQPPNHLLKVRLPSVVTEFKSIPVRQVPDLCRQVLGGRHVRALNQNGRHGYISLEPCFDLQTHVVSGIFETNSSRFVAGINPISADQHQHQVARGIRFLQHTAEVTTQGDTVHIHEDRILTQPRYEIIEQGSRLSSRVLPSVADEDGTHRTDFRVLQRMQPADTF